MFGSSAEARPPVSPGWPNAPVESGTTAKVSARAVPASTASPATRAAATIRRTALLGRGDPQPAEPFVGDRRRRVWLDGDEAWRGERLLFRRELRRDLLFLDLRLLRRGGVLGAPALLGLLQRDEEVVPVRGSVRGRLAVDVAREHVRDQRLRKGLHLGEVAFWN